MRFRTVFPAAFLAVVAAACGSSQEQQHERSPDLQARYDAAVARGEARVGMTRSEVRRALGEPLRKDRVRVGTRKLERWAYRWSEVYFDADGYCIDLRSAGR